jgi:hypothetical protein
VRHLENAGNQVLCLLGEQEHLDNGRYTLEMVRIDDKVREVITKIKLEEAAIAHRQNTVEGTAPQVSVAT